MSLQPQLPPSTAATAEARPLVVRFGAFGDIVLLTVLLRHLHLRFGKPVDVISSGMWAGPLLEGQPSLGRLFVIRSRRAPYWLSIDQQRLVAWLRERGAGPTWFCDTHLGRGLLRRGGIPDDYVCEYSAIRWRPDEGFTDRFIRLGNETPAALTDRLPGPIPAVSRSAQLVLNATDREGARAWLTRRGLAGRSFVVIHPGSSHISRRAFRSPAGTDRYWPEERWGEVIRAVRDLRPDHAVLLTGTRAERKFNAAIVARSGARDVHNVANELAVRELLAILERAHSTISIDTGPGHAAAALGCPTVALFGVQNPVLFRPGGATTPAVTLTGKVDGQQNILGITPQAVIDGWLDLLSAHPRNPPQDLS